MGAGKRHKIPGLEMKDSWLLIVMVVAMLVIQAPVSQGDMKRTKWHLHVQGEPWAQGTQILRGLLSALKGDIIAIILENKYACFLLQKETLSLFSKVVHFTNMFKSPKQKSVIVCLQDAQKQADCVLTIFKIWSIIISIHFLELKNLTFLG